MPSPTPPFQVVTSKTAGGNGLPNIYVADADGKKVAAVWGPESQRWDTAYLFAAAPALSQAIERLQKEVAALKAAFGAPGDYGYDTVKGQSLFELYKSSVAADATLLIARGERP